jgi:Peptidase family M23
VVLPQLSKVYLGALLLALALPAGAHATYGWPLRPFDRQHAVRSFFDDPRAEGTEASSFHFGIDIAAPDGTPVYAVTDGVARLQPDSVALVAATGDRTFSYWHVEPVVADLAHVAAGDELGTIKPGFGHVHFTEIHAGRYVNPLRPGGIEPYADSTSPTVVGLFAADGTRKLPLDALRGTVDLLLDTYDTPPPPLPAAPWNLTRVAPAYIRWRLLPAGATSGVWHTAVDFRSYLAPQTAYSFVYARWTTLNRPGRPARLVYYLAHAWSTNRLPDGRYRLQVAVFDSQGNSARAGIWLTIANAPIRTRGSRTSAPRTPSSLHHG